MAQRRFKKKDLLNMISALEKANTLMGGKGGSAMPDRADTLVQCQKAALVIGDYLETQGESIQRIVKVLENYCENIYQLSLAAGDDNKCGKIAKKIRQQLLTIKTAVREELPEDKKEIVFLPYKASMWDSLESLWRLPTRAARLL